MSPPADTTIFLMRLPCNCVAEMTKIMVAHHISDGHEYEIVECPWCGATTSYKELDEYGTDDFFIEDETVLFSYDNMVFELFGQLPNKNLWVRTICPRSEPFEMTLLEKPEFLRN